MITVNINISTNASEIEKKELYIPRDAIDDFLGKGFETNTYDGRVSFQCMPRAVNPNLMEVFLNIMDIVEGVIAIQTVVKYLVDFFRKCKGYEQNIIIEYKNGDEELTCEIPFTENDDAMKIMKEIRKIIKD